MCVIKTPELSHFAQILENLTHCPVRASFLLKHDIVEAKDKQDKEELSREGGLYQQHTGVVSPRIETSKLRGFALTPQQKHNNFHYQALETKSKQSNPRDLHGQHSLENQHKRHKECRYMSQHI